MLIRKYLKLIAAKTPGISHIMAMQRDLRTIASVAPQMRKIADVLVEGSLARIRDGDDRYRDARNLNRHERQVYSQSGEDGIVEEIFERVGTKDKFFVEFGVGDGLENNSLYLLIKGWSGVWIEGMTEKVSFIKNKFEPFISKGTLKVTNAHTTVENIERLFGEANVPREFDFLSIDIDRNDYWVWKAITTYSPRVIAIEYNALFPPGVKWVIPYEADAVWNRTSYFNASLKSLELLGKEKGYSLVACNLTGVNAFFLRNDLLENKFVKPFTSEKHYEPARYHLIRKNGRERDIGGFLNR